MIYFVSRVGMSQTIRLKTMCEAIEETDFTAENIKAKSIEKIAEMELKNGQFLWPFRVALSGKAQSVGPFDMAEVLGKKEVLTRVGNLVS